jgi:hypothetical protein
LKIRPFADGMAGGSFKAEGFGDGECKRSHPQAALEAATHRKNRFEKKLGTLNY